MVKVGSVFKRRGHHQFIKRVVFEVLCTLRPMARCAQVLYRCSMWLRKLLADYRVGTVSGQKYGIKKEAPAIANRCL